MSDLEPLTSLDPVDARRRDLARREQAVWDEYLRVSKGCAGDLGRYERAEPLAWRRLRRRIAELAHDRRRDAFERDRALAEAAGYRLAG